MWGHCVAYGAGGWQVVACHVLPSFLPSATICDTCCYNSLYMYHNCVRAEEREATCSHFPAACYTARLLYLMFWPTSSGKWPIHRVFSILPSDGGWSCSTAITPTGYHPHITGRMKRRWMEPTGGEQVLSFKRKVLFPGSVQDT